MKLLIIEDNPRLSMRLRDRLQKWYIVEIANTGEEGLEKAAKGLFDIILLDLGLPDTTGLEVCTQLRILSQHTPILVLTGIDTVVSRVQLLEAGADDYMTKPFQVPELRARINALSRRATRGDITTSIGINDLTVYPSTRTVMRGDIKLELRRKEYEILEYLLQNTGRILSRDMIINHAWPTTSLGGSGTVDVHINKLREIIDKPFNTHTIKTVYGVGYMIEQSEGYNAH